MQPKPPPTTTAAKTPPAKSFSVSSGKTSEFERIGIYGPGGAGKTTLASMLTLVKIKTLFIDLDNGSNNIDLLGRINAGDKPGQISNWSDLIDCLRSDIIADYDAIVIDSLTVAEEWAEEWTLANVPKIDKYGKESRCKNLKAYGWAEGDSHLFDTFLKFFQALERIDKHVILICHCTDEKVPNPAGEDYLSYMPRLPKSKQGDIRSKFRDWVDHLLFLNLERSVDENGKADDAVARVIYPQLLPHAWAKSRTLRKTITFREGIPDLWQQIFNTGDTK